MAGNNQFAQAQGLDYSNNIVMWVIFNDLFSGPLLNEA